MTRCDSPGEVQGFGGSLAAVSPWVRIVTQFMAIINKIMESQTGLV